MKDNYICNIDIDKLKHSNNQISLLDNSLSYKDFSTYFIDIEKEINSINFEHGNCIENYKEDIDSILEMITEIKKGISKLDNALSRTIDSFQAKDELTGSDIEQVSETYPKTTAYLKLKSIMSNMKDPIIKLLDNSENVQKIPPVETTTETSNGMNEIIPIGLAIGATGVVASTGAVYLSNKNTNNKNIELPDYEEEQEVLEESPKKEENLEDVFSKVTPYRAERDQSVFDIYND